jgi:hypothetical protein
LSCGELDRLHRNPGLARFREEPLERYSLRAVSRLREREPLRRVVGRSVKLGLKQGEIPVNVPVYGGLLGLPCVNTFDGLRGRSS